MVTLVAFDGIYAAGTFHLTPVELLLFGIGFNITTAFGAIVFGCLDDLFGAKPTFIAVLVLTSVELIIVIFTRSVILFWMIALLFGLSFGPVMAASRSLMARLPPSERYQKCLACTLSLEG